MRIGAASGPLDALNDTVNDIGVTYDKIMGRRVAMTKVSVMLGDATITKQSTFDPAPVNQMFSGILGRLKNWSSDGVVTTKNEDIRRIFVKFQTRVGSYIVSAHFSLQFHVLLYYVPDQQVIDCQKELSRVIDESKSYDTKFADISEQIIAEKLTSLYGEMNPEELFEKLYRDDTLRQDLENRADETRGDKMRQLDEQKVKLFDKLDSLLTETYQTTPTVIDEARLVTGEEGYLYSFDVEYMRGRTRHPIPHKISLNVIEKMRSQLKDVHAALLSYDDAG